LRLHDSFFAVVLEAQDLFVFDRRKNRSISSWFTERFQRIRFHLFGRATMRFQSLPDKMGSFPPFEVCGIEFLFTGATFLVLAK
jgi:hypothetical protein